MARYSAYDRERSDLFGDASPGPSNRNFSFGADPERGYASGSGSVSSRASASSLGKGAARLAYGALSLGALTWFHAFVAVVDGGAFTWSAIDSHHKQFGAIMDYLTVWGQLTQFLYFTFSLFVDLRVKRDLRDVTSFAPTFASRDVTDIGYFRERVLKEPTQKLLEHRDRFFALVFVTGNAVGLGFWLLLFPHKQVYGTFGDEWQPTLSTLLAHGFTFVAIWCETLSTRHVYKERCKELTIVMVYGLAYLAWNLICYDENKAFVYPVVQAGHSVGVDVVLYTGLELFFGVLYFFGRWITGVWWTSRLHKYGVDVIDDESPLLASQRLGGSTGVEVGTL